MTASEGADDEAWSLSDDERQRVVSQASAGISSLCFFSNCAITDTLAHDVAKQIESKAYERAKVESSTTTGSRPRKEVQRAYFRILGQNVVECAKDGCASARASKEAAATGSGDTLDLSPSGREFMTKELAEQMLQPMLAKGSQVSHMKLSTKSVGKDAAPVVVAAVDNTRATLTHADVSDIIAGRPEAEVLDVLRAVSAALARCRLRELDVSSNALGEKGIRACAEVLSAQGALEALYLENIGCSVNACAAVEELVRCATLRKVHLFNNMSDNAGARSIAALLARSPEMEDFKMASSRVGAEGAAALTAALASGTRLRRLDFTDNPMTPAVAPGLASLLPRQSGLTALVLSDVCLQDAGAVALAAALADPAACPALADLELALNEITREATPALARALAARGDALRRLVLADNELECAGAIHVAAGLRRAAGLVELDLRTNQIGRVGAAEVARVCCESKAALDRVELDDNLISEEGVQQVKGAFAAAFPERDVLGSLEENDQEGDPEDEDVLEEARGDVQGLDKIELDLGKLAI